MSETSSAEEHTTLLAKRGELNRPATQPMIQLLAPLSLIDMSKTATGQSLKDVNRVVRQAHCEASDKLHYPVISDPVFVSFADASWANRKDFGSQCGYLCVGTERSLLDGSAALVALSLGTLVGVPELYAHPVLLRLKRQLRHRKRPNSYDSCGWKLCKEVMTTQ